MVSNSQTKTIPLAAEAAVVGKQDVVAGKVRIETRTELVEELARANLRNERVDVTRVPIGRRVVDLRRSVLKGMSPSSPFLPKSFTSKHAAFSSRKSTSGAVSSSRRPKCLSLCVANTSPSIASHNPAIQERNPK